MVSYSWVCQLLRCLLDSPLNSFFPLSFPQSFSLCTFVFEHGPFESVSIILCSAEDLSRHTVSLSVFSFEVPIGYFNHSLMFRSNASTLWKVLATEPQKTTKRISTVLLDTLDTSH